MYIDHKITAVKSRFVNITIKVELFGEIVPPSSTPVPLSFEPQFPAPKMSFFITPPQAS